MKKLSLYVFLVLMVCNVGFATEVSDKILGKGRPDIVIECKFKGFIADYTKYYGFNKVDAGNDLKWTFHSFDGKEKKFNSSSNLVISVQEGNKITWDRLNDNDEPNMVTYLLHIDDSFKFPKTYDIKLDIFVVRVTNKKIINDIKDLAELQKELKETTTTNSKQHLFQLIGSRQHFTDIQQAILKDNTSRKLPPSGGIKTCSITSEKMENLEPVFVPKIKLKKNN